jgi:hypothetical protein
MGRQPLIIVANAELCKEVGIKKFKSMPNRSLPSPIANSPIHLKGLFSTRYSGNQAPLPSGGRRSAVKENMHICKKICLAIHIHSLSLNKDTNFSLILLVTEKKIHLISKTVQN